MKRAAMVDCDTLDRELDNEGYLVMPALLSPAQIAAVLSALPDARADAGSILHRVPAPLDAVARELHAHLAAISERWLVEMGAAIRQAPLPWDEPAPSHAILSVLPAGGQQALHQTPVADGDCPLELYVLLSQPGDDFTGGQFVMTEQRPRMQSRAIVVPLRRGDAVIYAAARRPVRNANGLYRANMKHAISPVRSGRRLAITVLFRAADAVAGHD